MSAETEFVLGVVWSLMFLAVWAFVNLLDTGWLG